MLKKVTLTIKGVHITDGDKNIIEETYKGEYSQKNDVHYIMYDENTEYGIIKNMIKVNNECVCLTKKGPMNSRMIFEKGNVTKCDYQTAYGQMLLDINTKNITAKLGEDISEMYLSIDYELMSEDILIDSCQLTVEVEE